MEGPFVSPARSGAMLKECMRLPSPETFSQITGEYAELIKLITVAPELEGATDFARWAKTQGIKVQAGHTDASYDEGNFAFDNGFCSLCHTFNAAKPIHHREPSVITAALLNENIFCEAICDLEHLHPGTIKLIYRCKGADKMLIVSDATMPCLLPDGEYFATNHPVIVKDSVCRTPQGNLSGGGCFIGEAVRRLINIGVPETDAFTMATRTPAMRLELADYGHISVGAVDHLTGLDENNRVIFMHADNKIYYTGE